MPNSQITLQNVNENVLKAISLSLADTRSSVTPSARPISRLNERIAALTYMANIYQQAKVNFALEGSDQVVKSRKKVIEQSYENMVAAIQKQLTSLRDAAAREFDLIEGKLQTYYQDATNAVFEQDNLMLVDFYQKTRAALRNAREDARKIVKMVFEPKGEVSQADIITQAKADGIQGDFADKIVKEAVKRKNAQKTENKAANAQKIENEAARDICSSVVPRLVAQRVFQEFHREVDEFLSRSQADNQEHLKHALYLDAYHLYREAEGYQTLYPQFKDNERSKRETEGKVKRIDEEMASLTKEFESELVKNQMIRFMREILSVDAFSGSEKKSLDGLLANAARTNKDFMIAVNAFNAQVYKVHQHSVDAQLLWQEFSALRYSPEWISNPQGELIALAKALQTNDFFAFLGRATKPRASVEVIQQEESRLRWASGKDIDALQKEREKFFKDYDLLFGDFELGGVLTYLQSFLFTRAMRAGKSSDQARELRDKCFPAVDIADTRKDSARKILANALGQANDEDFKQAFEYLLPPAQPEVNEDHQVFFQGLLRKVAKNGQLGSAIAIDQEQQAVFAQQNRFLRYLALQNAQGAHKAYLGRLEEDRKGFEESRAKLLGKVASLESIAQAAPTEGNIEPALSQIGDIVNGSSSGDLLKAVRKAVQLYAPVQMINFSGTLVPCEEVPVDDSQKFEPGYVYFSYIPKVDGVVTRRFRLPVDPCSTMLTIKVQGGKRDFVGGGDYLFGMGADLKARPAGAEEYSIFLGGHAPHSEYESMLPGIREQSDVTTEQLAMVTEQLAMVQEQAETYLPLLAALLASAEQINLDDHQQRAESEALSPARSMIRERAQKFSKGEIDCQDVIRDILHALASKESQIESKRFLAATLKSFLLALQTAGIWKGGLDQLTSILDGLISTTQKNNNLSSEEIDQFHIAMERECQDLKKRWPQPQAEKNKIKRLYDSLSGQFYQASQDFQLCLQDVADRLKISEQERDSDQVQYLYFSKRLEGMHEVFQRLRTNIDGAKEITLPEGVVNANWEQLLADIDQAEKAVNSSIFEIRSVALRSPHQVVGGDGQANAMLDYCLQLCEGLSITQVFGIRDDDLVNFMARHEGSYIYSTFDKKLYYCTQKNLIEIDISNRDDWLKIFPDSNCPIDQANSTAQVVLSFDQVNKFLPSCCGRSLLQHLPFLQYPFMDENGRQRLLGAWFGRGQQALQLTYAGNSKQRAILRELIHHEMRDAKFAEAFRVESSVSIVRYSSKYYELAKRFVSSAFGEKVIGENQQEISKEILWSEYQAFFGFMDRDVAGLIDDDLKRKNFLAALKCFNEILTLLHDGKISNPKLYRQQIILLGGTVLEVLAGRSGVPALAKALKEMEQKIASDYVIRKNREKDPLYCYCHDNKLLQSYTADIEQYQQGNYALIKKLLAGDPSVGVSDFWTLIHETREVGKTPATLFGREKAQELMCELVRNPDILANPGGDLETWVVFIKYLAEHAKGFWYNGTFVSNLPDGTTKAQHEMQFKLSELAGRLENAPQIIRKIREALDAKPEGMATATIKDGAGEPLITPNKVIERIPQYVLLLSSLPSLYPRLIDLVLHSGNVKAIQNMCKGFKDLPDVDASVSQAAEGACEQIKHALRAALIQRIKEVTDAPLSNFDQVLSFLRGDFAFEGESLLDVAGTDRELIRHLFFTLLTQMQMEKKLDLVSLEKFQGLYGLLRESGPLPGLLGNLNPAESAEMQKFLKNYVEKMFSSSIDVSTCQTILENGLSISPQLGIYSAEQVRLCVGDMLLRGDISTDVTETVVKEMIDDIISNVDLNCYFDAHRSPVTVAVLKHATPYKAKAYVEACLRAANKLEAKEVGCLAKVLKVLFDAATQTDKMGVVLSAFANVDFTPSNCDLWDAYFDTLYSSNSMKVVDEQILRFCSVTKQEFSHVFKQMVEKLNELRRVLDNEEGLLSKEFFVQFAAAREAFIEASNSANLSQSKGFELIQSELGRLKQRSKEVIQKRWSNIVAMIHQQLQHPKALDSVNQGLDASRKRREFLSCLEALFEESPVAHPQGSLPLFKPEYKGLSSILQPMYNAVFPDTDPPTTPKKDSDTISQNPWEVVFYPDGSVSAIFLLRLSLMPEARKDLIGQLQAINCEALIAGHPLVLIKTTFLKALESSEESVRGVFDTETIASLEIAFRQMKILEAFKKVPDSDQFIDLLRDRDYQQAMQADSFKACRDCIIKALIQQAKERVFSSDDPMKPRIKFIGEIKRLIELVAEDKQEELKQLEKMHLGCQGAQQLFSELSSFLDNQKIDERINQNEPLVEFVKFIEGPISKIQESFSSLKENYEVLGRLEVNSYLKPVLAKLICKVCDLMNNCLRETLNLSAEDLFHKLLPVASGLYRLIDSQMPLDSELERKLGSELECAIYYLRSNIHPFSPAFVGVGEGPSPRNMNGDQRLEQRKRIHAAYQFVADLAPTTNSGVASDLRPTGKEDSTISNDKRPSFDLTTLLSNVRSLNSFFMRHSVQGIGEPEIKASPFPFRFNTLQEFRVIWTQTSLPGLSQAKRDEMNRAIPGGSAFNAGNRDGQAFQKEVTKAYVKEPHKMRLFYRVLAYLYALPRSVERMNCIKLLESSLFDQAFIERVINLRRKSPENLLDLPSDFFTGVEHEMRSLCDYLIKHPQLQSVNGYSESEEAAVKQEQDYVCWLIQEGSLKEARIALQNIVTMCDKPGQLAAFWLKVRPSLEQRLERARKAENGYSDWQLLVDSKRGLLNIFASEKFASLSSSNEAQVLARSYFDADRVVAWLSNVLVYCKHCQSDADIPTLVELPKLLQSIPTEISPHFSLVDYIRNNVVSEFGDMVHGITADRPEMIGVLRTVMDMVTGIETIAGGLVAVKQELLLPAAVTLVRDAINQFFARGLGGQMLSGISVCQPIVQGLVDLSEDFYGERSFEKFFESEKITDQQAQQFSDWVAAIRQKDPAYRVSLHQALYVFAKLERLTQQSPPAPLSDLVKYLVEAQEQSVSESQEAQKLYGEMLANLVTSLIIKLNPASVNPQLTCDVGSSASNESAPVNSPLTRDRGSSVSLNSSTSQSPQSLRLESPRGSLS